MGATASAMKPDQIRSEHQGLASVCKSPNEFLAGCGPITFLQSFSAFFRPFSETKRNLAEVGEEKLAFREIFLSETRLHRCIG